MNYYLGIYESNKHISPIDNGVRAPLNLKTFNTKNGIDDDYSQG